MALRLGHSWYKKTTEKRMLGLRVRIIGELQNGYAVVPPGTLATITKKFDGLSLTCDPCEHCGMKVRIGRVNPSEVELVAEDV